MTDREKMIELVTGAHNAVTDKAIENHSTFGMSYGEQIETETDFLLANGVTFQKWIPVPERLPEKGQSGVFPYESNNVLVYREYYDEIRVGHYDYRWNEFYTVDDLLMGRVTHWMPLPQPPKEDN